MNRIDEKFADLKDRGEKALIAYFTAGFPSASATIDIAKKAEDAGVDIIELGVPFSDPIADGPIIQHASFKALENGINTDVIFDMCGNLKEFIKIPYLLMTYYNPVYKYGLARFSRRCAETGVSGIIIPDLPYEESGEIRKKLERFDIRLISFLTPYTTLARAKKILSDAEGFVYFITSAGVTGPRAGFSKELTGALKKVKGLSNVPVAAGFGVSSAEQIMRIREYVDGVIVGSFFVKTIIDGKMEKLWEDIRELKRPLAERKSC